MIRIEQQIDFTAEGCTGSRRFKPATREKLAERRRKHREEYAPKYRAEHREQELQRWRNSAAARRAADPEKARQANREWYARNRATVLASKAMQHQTKQKTIA